MKRYIVKRPHQGDKWYGIGDEREARPADVTHLVRTGVLVEPEAKADEAPANKAIQSAPENKSAARKS